MRLIVVAVSRRTHLTLNMSHPIPFGRPAFHMIAGVCLLPGRSHKQFSKVAPAAHRLALVGVAALQQVALEYLPPLWLCHFCRTHSKEPPPFLYLSVSKPRYSLTCCCGLGMTGPDSGQPLSTNVPQSSPCACSVAVLAKPQQATDCISVGPPLSHRSRRPLRSL